MLDHRVATGIFHTFSWPAAVPKPKMRAGRGPRMAVTGGRPVFIFRLEGKRGFVEAVAVSPERALHEAVVLWISAHNPKLPAEELASALHLLN